MSAWAAPTALTAFDVRSRTLCLGAHTECDRFRRLHPLSRKDHDVPEVFDVSIGNDVADVRFVLMRGFHMLSADSARARCALPHFGEKSARSRMMREKRFVVTCFDSSTF